MNELRTIISLLRDLNDNIESGNGSTSGSITPETLKDALNTLISESTDYDSLEQLASTVKSNKDSLDDKQNVLIPSDSITIDDSNVISIADEFLTKLNNIEQLINANDNNVIDRLNEIITWFDGLSVDELQALDVVTSIHKLKQDVGTKASPAQGIEGEDNYVAPKEATGLFKEVDDIKEDLKKVAKHVLILQIPQEFNQVDGPIINLFSNKSQDYAWWAYLSEGYTVGNITYPQEIQEDNRTFYGIYNIADTEEVVYILYSQEEIKQKYYQFIEVASEYDGEKLNSHKELFFTESLPAQLQEHTNNDGTFQQILNVFNDDFYNALQIEKTMTAEEFYDFCMNHPVFLDVNGIRFTFASITHVEDSIIVLTCHAHSNESSGDDSISVYDVVYKADFRVPRLSISIIMYPDSELHMAAPYMLELRNTITQNEDGDNIETLQLYDNDIPLLAEQVTRLLMQGKRLTLGVKVNDELYHSDNSSIFLSSSSGFGVAIPSIIKLNDGEHLDFEIMHFDRNGQIIRNTTKDIFIAGNIFSETHSQSNYSTKELVVDVYLKNTELPYTKPYSMSSDRYEQDNFWMFPRVESESDIDEWYNAKDKKITCVIHRDVIDLFIGDDIPFNELTFTAEHLMSFKEDDLASFFVDYTVNISTVKIQCLLQIDKDSADTDKYGFVFNMIPAIPVTIEAKEIENSKDYEVTIQQSPEYVKAYIENGGTQIMVISKNYRGIVTGHNLFYASAAYYANGTPSLIMATVPNINNEVIYCVVNTLGTASYATIPFGYTNNQVDQMIKNAVESATAEYEQKFKEIEETNKTITERLDDLENTDFTTENVDDNSDYENI